ncbi:MAG: AmmeMemoRadiSam system protein B [Candidatus Aminicenantales bacterium]
MEREIPRLRHDIDIVPAVCEGKRAFLVKDSLGLIPKPLVLTEDALRLIGLIDGKRDIRDIQLALVRHQGGVFVSLDEIRAKLAELDQAFLLDSLRYREEKRKKIQEYARLTIRKPALAGRAYPEDPDELAAYLDAILDQASREPTPLAEKPPSALVSPHIDLEVGKGLYAKAYGTLRRPAPARVLLLGTGHSLQEALISVTTKDFWTPLGRVKTEKECVRNLKKAGSKVVASDDIAHKSEHSLEFQLLFLQRIFGSGFRLIPVLCGSFHRMLETASRPGEIPGMQEFLEALKACVPPGDPSTLVVAGVDFSHIGPKFGHRQKAASLLMEAQKHDRSLLEALCRGDGEAFWRGVKGTKDAFHVCGFSALAVLIELFPGRKGCLLGYDVWMEEATQSAVSFAAVVF